MLQGPGQRMYKASNMSLRLLQSWEATLILKDRIPQSPGSNAWWSEVDLM